MHPETLRLFKIFSIAGAAAVLAACANTSSISDRNAPLIERSSDGAPIANVNRYLWRASLDTIDFMPINNADPVAGLITTDWHSAGQTASERFKTNVYVLDSTLRADALRVAVFRQQLTEAGWIDVQTNDATAREIENSILTRARQLRLNSLDD